LHRALRERGNAGDVIAPSLISPAGSSLQIAVVAVARELVGFLSAVMRDLPTREVAAA
jgi:hypothetical protein